MSTVIKLPDGSIIQSYEDWQQSIISDFGIKNVDFRSVGANGWDRLEIVEGKPTLVHHKGHHWVDAVPCNINPMKNSGKLLGTYSHNCLTGKQFFSIKQTGE
jgi:hypothetical protein